MREIVRLGQIKRRGEESGYRIRADYTKLDQDS